MLGGFFVVKDINCGRQFNTFSVGISESNRPQFSLNSVSPRVMQYPRERQIDGYLVRNRETIFTQRKLWTYDQTNRDKWRDWHLYRRKKSLARRLSGRPTAGKEKL